MFSSFFDSFQLEWSWAGNREKGFFFVCVLNYFLYNAEEEETLEESCSIEELDALFTTTLNIICDTATEGINKISEFSGERGLLIHLY